jgi:hypothetical protein
MPRLSAKLYDQGGGRLVFWCPGCDAAHTVSVAPGHWSYNGNPEAPTFSPSVLARSGHHMDGHDGRSCWCTYNADQVASGKEPSSFKCRRCHSFVSNGMIQFLDDCSHALAGHTVPLADLPEHLEE